MVDMHYKVRGIIGMRNIWFWDGLPLAGSFASTQYHGVREEWTGRLKNVVSSSLQYSALTALTKSEDELWSAIKKNVKYDIRRGEKEGIEPKHFLPRQIDQGLLQDFSQVYEQMYADKGLSASFEMDTIKRYIDCEAMEISAAYIEGIPVVFHAYICDERNVRLYYSASSFRQEKEKNAMFARANKLLHWADIRQFKERGIELYDWGGIAEPDQPNGIDLFKLSFGGELTAYYNVRTETGLMGKAVKLYEEMRG